MRSYLMQGPRWMWPVNLVKAAALIALGVLVALWPFIAAGLLLLVVLQRL